MSKPLDNTCKQSSDLMAAVPTQTVKEKAQRVLQANKEHQYALNVYTERLEAELQTVDKLLGLAEVDSEADEPDLDVGGYVFVPGSRKAVGLILAKDLLDQESPFHAHASERMRYLDLISPHPWKARDLNALAEAVRIENCRKQSFEAQRLGQSSFTATETVQTYVERNTEGLDWDLISERVSTATSTRRSSTECKVRWLGDQHPDINRTPWLPAELSELETLVSENPERRVDWVKIARDLGTGRSPFDCMRRGGHRENHVWTPRSDDRLLEAVEAYGTDNWGLVARHVSEDASVSGCQGRYYRTLDPTLKRSAWTEEEDNKLRRAVDVYGNLWHEVASYLPGRHNDQCRERWTERLEPLSKRKWTDKEDRELLQAVDALGVKWKDVSLRLNTGRTDKMCRSRYDSLTKRTFKWRVPLPDVSSDAAACRTIEDTELPTSGPPLRLQSASAKTDRKKPTRPRPRPRLQCGGDNQTSAEERAIAVSGNIECGDQPTQPSESGHSHSPSDGVTDIRILELETSAQPEQMQANEAGNGTTETRSKSRQRPTRTAGKRTASQSTGRVSQIKKRKTVKRSSGKSDERNAAPHSAEETRGNRPYSETIVASGSVLPAGSDQTIERTAQSIYRVDEGTQQNPLDNHPRETERVGPPLGNECNSEPNTQQSAIAIPSQAATGRGRIKAAARAEQSTRRVTRKMAKAIAIPDKPPGLG